MLTPFCLRPIPFLLALLCSLLVVQTVTHAAPPEDVQSITVPYISGRSGTQLVQVIVNKGVHATFLLDTGTNYSGISEDFCRRLKLTPKPTDKDITTTLGGSRSKMMTVLVPLMIYGGLRLVNSSFGVVDMRTVSNILGQNVDGIIGENVLAVFPALFDFQKHQVTFWQRSPTPDELKQVGMADALAVPVEDKDHDDNYRFPMKLVDDVNTADAMMMVDTGAENTSIPSATATQLGLEPTQHGSAQILYGTLHVARATVSLLAFGPVVVFGVPIIYPETPSDPKFAEYLGNSTGLLGLDILARYRVLFDYPENKIYFKAVGKSEGVSDG